MGELRQYIISICAAAIFCAITAKLSDRDKTIGTVIRTVTGLFLIFTILSPLTKLRLDNLPDWLSDFSEEASGAVAQGEQHSNNMLAQRIKERVNTYILDKAATYGAVLQVEVLLGDEDLPMPVGVILEGDVSPYVKQHIGHWLEQELGIPGENQIWK